MGLFDIPGVDAGDIFDSVKDTVGSFAKSGVAPVGMVWDLASSPFDDEDHTFGSLLGEVGERGQQLLAPALDPDTITGAAFGGVMDAANWALDNAVNRPLSSFFLNVGHATAGESVGERFGTLLSPDDWAEAWQKSDTTNAGQALAAGILGGEFEDQFKPGFDGPDPFDYEDPYQTLAKDDHAILAPGISWGANIAGALLLDPAAGVGKGLGLVRQYSKGSAGYGRLTNAQKAQLGNLLSDSTSREANRVTNFGRWVRGANPTGRPLSAEEIKLSTPSLTRWGRDPDVTAALLADAASIRDEAESLNAMKSIIAVAAGDTSAIARVQQQVTELPTLADALKNVKRGNVLELKRAAANANLATNPLFIRHLEKQVANLDTEKGISKVIDEWGQQLDLLGQQADSLGALPGVQGGMKFGQSRRALLRNNEVDESGSLLKEATSQGLGRAGLNLHRGIERRADEWVSRRDARIANGEMRGLFFQKSMYHVPLYVARTSLNATAGMYTKALPKVSDALRTTHFTGVANLHNWGDSSDQLDSMMKLSHVPTGERMQMLSRVMGAKTEAEKVSLIHSVEKKSLTSLAKHYAAKTGEDIDANYIQTLFDGWARQRAGRRSQMLGRAYAAQSAGDDIAARQMDKFSAMRAKSAEKVGDGAATLDPDTKVKLRVDQFLDDEGLPVAMPLLESQLANQVPLMDLHMAKRLLKRDMTQLSRLSKAWAAEAEEHKALLSKLPNAKGTAAKALKQSIAAKNATLDWLAFAGQRASRFWKMSVLFRLGYPMRVVMDDHWRIWSEIGAGSFYGSNLPEATRNFAYNRVGRKRDASKARQQDKELLRELLSRQDSEQMLAYPARLEAHTKAANSARAHKGRLTKLRNEFGDDADQAKVEHHERKIAEAEAEMAYLQEQMGQQAPEEIQALIDDVAGRLRENKYKPEKRAIGSADVEIAPGITITGALSGRGASFRGLASSKETFDYQMQGVEDAIYGGRMVGAHRTIQSGEAAYMPAWTDLLNNQILNSKAAMHFVKGGSVDEFVAWVKAPEQALLRKRLPHLAHDAEDWGERLVRLVEDVVPNERVRQELASGKRVTQKFLEKVTDEGFDRPMAIHGRAVADTTGASSVMQGIGNVINKTFSYLSDLPTDRLSRHPYFNSMYKQHAKNIYATKVASKGEGAKFTQDDLSEIETRARKLALADVKRTLFDVSAHSHAAHAMRFLSPFFAAHQEVLQRWWRILGNNPGIARRFQQGFDLPRYMGIVVDDDGNKVEPGDPISLNHSFVLPAALVPGDSSWTLNENSFNLVLQGGLTNPGAGPLVTVPVETLAAEYADEPTLAAVARMFNPFPPKSPQDAAFPATFKRAMAAFYGFSQDGKWYGIETGVGKREWFDTYNRNLTDLYVDFQLQNGRVPTKAEASSMKQEAKAQSYIEAWIRVGQNAISPAPARPDTKYSAIQDAGYRLLEQGRTRYPNDWLEGREWALEQFKRLYGAAYMPLLMSDAKNPGGLDGSPAEVEAYRKYKPIMQQIDPKLSRVVLGMYAEKSGNVTERTAEGRNFFEDERISPGSTETYMGTDEPDEFFDEQLARQGWEQYDALTASLTAYAQQQGLSSYLESDELVALRSAGLAKIKEQNYAFARDIDSFDSGRYDSYLDDMRQIVGTPALANDPMRTDIQTLKNYLAVRDYFVGLLDRRKAAGMGGWDAQENEVVKQVFTQIVGNLVESNTYFESHIFNGLVEYDPLLVGN